MSNPQQPEIARSRKTPSQDPDSAAALVESSRLPADDGPVGPVPPDNQPGHRPPKDQDKPDLDAFAERLGTTAGPDSRAPAAADGGPAGDVGLPATSSRAPVRRVAAAFLVAVGMLVLGRIVRRRLASA